MAEETTERAGLGFEEKLFDWKSYNFEGDASIFFVHCKLKQNIGKFKKGSKIPVITVDFEKSKMIFEDNGRRDDTFHKLEEVDFEIVVKEKKEEEKK
jgi:hypothetical protein